VDSFGRRLRVVFPGRRWGGPGPDFHGAVLALEDGRLIRGDVELHRRARDWVEHRHAADPAYAQVVLHVVLVADAPTLGGDGQPIATLALPLDAPEHAAGGVLPHTLGAPEHAGGVPRTKAARWWALGTDAPRAPCVRDASEVLAIVEAAGLARFRARVARFEGDLALVEPDQVVWRGVAEALGYTRNTAAFGLLADAVPWAEAARVVVERGPAGLAGLLLGTAGLLDQASLPEAHAWRALKRQRGLRPALQRSSWDRRELRAANAPVQRCRGLAALAARWSSSDAAHAHTALARDDDLDAYAGVVSEPVPRNVQLAEQAVDLVRSASRLRRPTLWRCVRTSPWIGRGRAQVLVINVLLPFAAAAGVAEAEDLFARLAGEPTNRVVRYMAELLGGPGVRFRGARHQQGLVQLFKETCATRHCELCPARRSAPIPVELWA